MSFDERATSGFGRDEGAGSIVLKPLEDALHDGDLCMRLFETVAPTRMAAHQA